MAVRINIVVLFMLVLCTGMFSCKKKTKGGLPDMRVTLASNDAKPMGGKVFRTIAGKVFDDFVFENNAQPFDAWYKKFLEDYYQDMGSAYVLVSPYVSPHKAEAEKMKNFISDGNTMLMITDGVSDAFKEVFGIGIKKFPFTLPSNEYGLAYTYKFSGDSLSLDTTRFGYFFYPFTSIIDSVKQEKVVARNMFGIPDGIEMEIGTGRLILVTNAQAVSNYFLLTGENYRYAVGLLSHLNFNPDAIYWDEFYRRNLNRPGEDQSVFDAILSNPALRWAFWLLLALCAIAIFTNLFRRQRVIPVRKPNRNTTVEFTQTIARLYYNKKDNRNIALKMIQHFMEHIRSSFYLPHQKLDDAFATVLAGKTNQPVPKTQRIVQRMWNIQQGAEVSDDQLLELNRQLNELMKPAVPA
jgi:hypothetical protein